MIVCDICKKNRAYESFSIPKNNEYWAMKNGVHLMPFYKIEKTDVAICDNCQATIARFVYAMESESVVPDNK